jgi:inosine-uridine nucleoside N-ribohydrolase
MAETLPIMAVLDTDTFNEVDDQFTLAYALLASEVIDLRAVVAAPFSNFRAATPGEGMQKSYGEICRILNILGRSPENFAWRGSASYLPDRKTPVESEGARRIVELAHEARTFGKKLYVLAIAAITDVASALLMAPEIARDVTVVWLGSHEAGHQGENNEFNLRQDVAAAQIVFDADVPLVWIPCRDVASALEITLAELRPGLAPAGKIGEFLYGRTEELINLRRIQAKIIWDISTVAYFSVPKACEYETIPAPIVNDDKSLSTAPMRRKIVRVKSLDRKKVFADLFEKLSRAGEKRQ